MKPRTGSLRTKLMAAGAAVLLVVLGFTGLASSRWLQRTLSNHAEQQAAHIVGLLGHAVEAPLAQRDDATLQQILDSTRSHESIAYLVLWDHRGKALASSGWPADRPLPPRDRGELDLDRADTVAHLGAPVVVGGQRLGRLDLGLSTLGLRQERRDFMQRSAAMAGVAMLVAVLLLWVIATAITRHLARLSQAARRMADGDFDVEVSAPTRDEIGQLAGAFNDMAAALSQRVAALQQSERDKGQLLASAREEQARLTTLLGALEVAILFVDAHGRVAYLNQAFQRLWGLAPAAEPPPLALIIDTVQRALQPDDAAGVPLMLQPGITLPERELRCGDGRIVVQHVQRVDEAGTGGSIWLHRDVTEERRTQRRADQALRDPLTRLLNRRGLFEALPLLLADAQCQGERLSLMFIDLDDFKRANDVGGHRTGDEVLVAVARTLEEHLRDGQTLARLGGDEFAVVCPRLGADAAGSVATRLIQAVAGLRFQAAGQTLQVGCSIGLAQFPDDAEHADDLVARADGAMYQAKAAGKNDWARWQVDEARRAMDSARTDWNQRLQQALREGGLVLHFQPVVHAADGRLAYHEALLRLSDEREGGRLIPPSQFIGHAEHSGRIRAIDRWVFEAGLQLLNGSPASIVLALKLSAASLQDSAFHAFLRERLQRHDVDPRRLRIELTGHSASGDAALATRRVHALRELGCSVHLAHFGAAFHSFAQLKQWPVDVIKLDGSFVRNLPHDESNRLFVASMIAIAHHQGRQVVAEHVEDEASAVLLRQMGVDLMQGFHVGRPLSRLPEGGGLPRLRVVSDSRLTDFG